MEAFAFYIALKKTKAGIYRRLKCSFYKDIAVIPG